MLEMHTYALWYYKKAAGLRPWDGKMWLAVGSCLERMERDRDGIKALKRALLADADYDVGSSFGSGAVGAAGEPRGLRNTTGHMDPETLLQIANMYNRLGEIQEAKAYMELCLAQEDGAAAAAGGDGARFQESIAIHHDSPPGSDDGRGAAAAAGGEPRGGGGDGHEGTGVTAATSRARMWLARYALETDDFAVANRLATELCEDGVEVEEAKALLREVRSRMDGGASSV
jgi:anaphase-promoting complex subunit 8